ncbi:MAG: TetR/AcrR family transcriptional regulator [Coriobacteriia bacterium]
MTREEILTAALAIIDTEGLDALSMRRLARELRVEAMTLYHHVENKDAILAGVSELVISGMRIPDPIPDNWMDLIEMMLVSFREALAAHPNAMSVVVQNPLQGPTSETYTAAPVRALSNAGFTPEQSAEIFGAIMAYTFGHALLGSASAGSPDPFDEAAFRKPLRYMLSGFGDEVDTHRSFR